MSTIIEYPMNFYSRLVTNASGSSPAWLVFLNHADRATVSSGTWFVDQSTFDAQIYARGTSVIQSTAAGYFGSSGLLFNNSSSDSRIAWTMTAFTATTATNSIPALQVEVLLYLTSLPTTNAYWYYGQNDDENTYQRSYFYQTGTQWRVVVQFYQVALGLYFSHEYVLNTMATGTWMHMELLRVNAESPGSGRIGMFQNGSQLTCVAGGFPTSGTGDWRDCSFNSPAVTRWAWGGAVNVGVNNITGYMDEMRILYDSIEGLVHNTFPTDFYYVSVPTSPYTPIDGTFNISAKTLVLNSVALMPASDALISLGQTGTQWNNLWINGKAYIDGFGESALFDSVAQLQFRDTTTYIWSSGSGYLTFTAGTQIDFQANVGMAAKNFIFDTVTGVKIATATNQKMGFYNATPIVQPSGNIITALQNLGLVSSAMIPNTASFVTTSTTYALTTADNYLFCNSGTAFTVTLPVAVGSFKNFIIKNIGTANVTLSASSDSIEGNAFLTLAQWSFANVIDHTARVLSSSFDADIATGSTIAADSYYGGGFEPAKAIDDSAATVWSSAAAAFPHWLMLDYGEEPITDVATGGTPAADSQYDGSFAAANAFDDNNTTVWSSSSSAFPHWIRYDFGAGNEKTVLAYSLRARSSSLTWSPMNFVCQVGSDTVNWVTLSSVTGISFAASQKLTFQGFANATAYRYAQISISATPANPAGGSGIAQLAEVQFATATDYTTRKTINKYTVQARTDTQNSWAPKDFTLQGSNDYSNWVTLDSRADQIFALAEVKTYDAFTVGWNTIAYRFIKLNITATAASGTNITQLAEWETMQGTLTLTPGLWVQV
ncbi:MAG: discoidin domain-containing protein [Patescibacteria group bacterium]|jgi:hypothetical protein